MRTNPIITFLSSARNGTAPRVVPMTGRPEAMDCAFALVLSEYRKIVVSAATP